MLRFSKSAALLLVTATALTPLLFDGLRPDDRPGAFRAHRYRNR